MKEKRKKMLYFLLGISFCLVVVILPDVIVGQPPGFGGGEQEIPIDGGLGILAALGGAYAIKKLRDNKE